MKRNTFVLTTDGKTGQIIEPQTYIIGFYDEENEYQQLAATTEKDNVSGLKDHYKELITEVVRHKTIANLVQLGDVQVRIKDKQLTEIQMIRFNFDPVNIVEAQELIAYCNSHNIKYYMS